MVSQINAKNFEAAEQSWLSYKVPKTGMDGLKKRRKDESTIFSAGIYPDQK